MSLTHEAQFKREWGNTPELAKILSGKEIPWHYFGASSASDNPFEQVERTLKHAILLREYEKDILSEAQNIDHERRAQLQRDLIRERERLLGWAKEFDDHIRFTEELLRELDQLP